MPVLVAIVFIIVVGLIAFLTVVVQKYTPGKERSDLQNYYNLVEEDDMSVILNNQKTEELCKYIDGHAYVTYEFVHNVLNERFYWDANENILRYTTPTDVISVDAGSTDYYVTKEKNTESYVIVRVDGNAMYVALDFIQKYTNIDFTIYEEPNRVLITNEWGEVETAVIKKDTEIREKAGIKSPIVADLTEGATVTLIEELDDWTRVCTQDGMIGYLKTKRLEDLQTVTTSREFEEPEFTHLLKEEKINLAWHQVYSQTSNDNVANMLQGSKGVNVISPTWFYLNDNQGNIKSLASSAYVDYCHRNGIEVWALFNNLENPEVDTTYVLTHTSARDYMTNQLISLAIEYNLDGINLDFEELDIAVGDGYIQFIRELSVKCKKNGIILSVDNYVPSDYTAFYNRAEQAVFADYVIVMAYDEHNGITMDGSGASIGFVTKGLEDTMAEVPAEQIILGMPLYTRLWECVPKEDITEQEAADENFVPYTVSSSTISDSESEDYISINGAEKVWSEEDGQYYAQYEKNGNTYKIWVEDEYSMEPRLKLMKEKNVAGAAFWSLNWAENSIWDVIIKYIN